ncbi:unnamed protein product [Laminaria digitata]
MSSMENYTSSQLLAAVSEENFHGAKTALEAGANVNGHPQQPYTPIMAATLMDCVDMVEFLIERGADPDRPVTKEVKYLGSDAVLAIPGARVLHVAVRNGLTEIVRLLLKRGADPNATDSKHRTPLMGACSDELVFVEPVQMLLETGADLTLARNGDFIPLHAVALHGHTDVVDMLCSRAPATLNQCTSDGKTPLVLACYYGHESVVSKLLSLGAMQPVSPDDGTCPLAIAVSKGFVGVVQVLVNEGGIRAVGGEGPFSRALHRAVQAHSVRILRLLLAADGEERRSERANNSLNGACLLHCGAAFCSPAVVSVLLEAGADETARDSQGRIPRDIIGLFLGLDNYYRVDQGKDPGQEVAIRRMLQRGSAHRARSWAWPSDKEADVGGSGDGGTAAASTVAVLSSPPAVKTPPVVGVRIFRPKENSSSKFFVRLIGRYCAKD